MTEAVNGSNEIIDRLRLCILLNQRIQNGVVRIGKEHRLDIGIVHADMLHAVFLLVTACQFVLLDNTRHIVVHISTHHKTILSLAVHRLCIDIIVLLLILHKPTLILKLLEVLSGFLVDAGIILAGTLREINLGFDDVIKTLFVVAGLSTCFF